MFSTTPRISFSGSHTKPVPSPPIYTSAIMATTSIDHTLRLKSSGVPVTPLFALGLSTFTTTAKSEHLLETLDARVQMVTNSADLELHDTVFAPLQATPKVTSSGMDTIFLTPTAATLEIISSPTSHV